MTNLPSAYTSIASVYDHWTKQFGYSKVAQFVDTLLPGGLDGAEVLDVCCGTGVLAEIMISRGARVTGVDQSVAMLEVASERLGRARGHGMARLLQYDACALPLKLGKYDLAVSTLDSLNYFSPTQLQSVFAGVRACLKPGAVFVFDVNTPYKLRELFGSSVYSEAHENYAYIWRNSLRDTSICFEIDLFKRAETGDCYERTREMHIQHILETEALVNALLTCGFCDVAVTDDYTGSILTRETLRATFVSRAS